MVPMKIKRNIFNRLVDELSEPQILILVGPRQVGKTTLLLALEKWVKSQGKRTQFLDLEQPSDLKLILQNEAGDIPFLTNEIDFLFIDEFYYLENAGKIFKAIFDQVHSGKKNPLKIILSGSSSVEIHSHLKESLAGRTITYHIFPLSFQEYMNWESKNRPTFDEYLCYGGLPGLADITDNNRKQILLQEFLSTYLFKDIKSLVKEENIRAFNHLLYLLAQNQGQLLEVSNLARELKMSATTISKYLDIMDKTYVNFSLSSFHTNLANELKKSRKTYLYDLGIRNSILRDFREASDRPDAGCIFETFVFLTLYQNLKPNMELRFWRTKKKEEVDFILIKNRQPIPIEVKRNLSKHKVHPGIKSFCRKYPKVKESYLISEKAHHDIIDNGVTHHFIGLQEMGDLLLPL